MTDDDQPSGSCPTCRRRDPRVEQLCDVCRSRLRASLFDIPALYAELEERIEERSVPSDVRVALTVTEWDAEAKRAVRVPATVARPSDPAAYWTPSGASSSASRGGPVSGSKEKRLPIDTDAVDLTGPVRSAGVAVLDEDAVGYESVASVLDFWVEDWRADRGAGERRPSATVPELARWLLDRLDDACDSAPAIGEFFEAIRLLRGALRRELKLVDVPDYKRGIPCGHCGALTLVHHDGSDRIECASCPALLSFIEYDAHVRALSAVQVQLRRSKVAKVKAVRRLVTALRAAGWRHTIAHEESERGDDGAPIHEGYRVHRWTRGAERVECWAYQDAAPVPISLWYSAGETEAQLALNVGVDWVKTNGIPALQKLARAAGILTAPKKEEATA